MTTITHLTLKKLIKVGLFLFKPLFNTSKYSFPNVKSDYMNETSLIIYISVKINYS